MQYQKINLFGKTQNKPYKFRSRDLVEINAESPGNYGENSQINQLLVSGTTIIDGGGDDDAPKLLDERNKEVKLKICVPLTEFMSNTNNIQIHNAEDIDVVMSMYNLIEHSDNYSKTSGSLWQQYRDDPNDNIAQYESLKSKIKITGKKTTIKRTIKEQLIGININLN